MLLRECKCGAKAYDQEDLELFVKSDGYKHGRRNMCKACDNKRQVEKRGRPRHPRVFRDKNESRLFRKYGLLNKDYFLMFKEQKGMCKICNAEPSSPRNNGHKHLAVDHNHETMEIRGLLCMSCNVSLGLMEESVNLIKKMINFMESS